MGKMMYGNTIIPGSNFRHYVKDVRTSMYKGKETTIMAIALQAQGSKNVVSCYVTNYKSPEELGVEKGDSIKIKLVHRFAFGIETEQNTGRQVMKLFFTANDIEVIKGKKKPDEQRAEEEFDVPDNESYEGFDENG